MVYTSSFLSHTFFFHEYRTKYELINFVGDPRDRYVIRTIEGLLSLCGYWENGVYCNDENDEC